MGSIRTNFIKSLSQRLLETYPDRFGTDFEQNKKALDGLNLIDEKFTRNKLAGYIATLAKKAKRTGA